jgi:hypothetical protein
MQLNNEFFSTKTIDFWFRTFLLTKNSTFTIILTLVYNKLRTTTIINNPKEICAKPFADDLKTIDSYPVSTNDFVFTSSLLKHENPKFTTLFTTVLSRIITQCYVLNSLRWPQQLRFLANLEKLWDLSLHPYCSNWLQLHTKDAHLVL